MINKKSKNVIIIITVIITLSVFILTCGKNQHFKLSQFIAPETCGGCHGEIFDQWKNSMHHLSHFDPVYHSVAKYMLKGLTDKDEIDEAESCVKCHTPVGVVTGYPTKVSEEFDKIPDIAKQGIQCDYCHSSTKANKIYNNGLVLDPGDGEDDPGIKRGPFKDSESDYHRSEFSEFHTSSEICGTCHNVKHVVFGTDLETTYTEWKNSPYNSDDKTRVTCQGCHMYHRPGVPSTGETRRPKNPGKAVSGGIKRDHIFTHYFVGGNSFIPDQFKDNEKAAMAIERLKHSAKIKISDKIERDSILISVKNTGAGHYLPTGLTDVRQMWLEVTIKDINKKILIKYGGLNKKGYLKEDTIIYNTVFGDGKGNPVENIAKAREILRDRRIPPQRTLNEKIKISGFKNKKIIVEVKLFYRSAPQKLIDKINGKGKVKLPVIEMERESAEFKI